MILPLQTVNGGIFWSVSSSAAAVPLSPLASNSSILLPFLSKVAAALPTSTLHARSSCLQAAVGSRELQSQDDDVVKIPSTYKEGPIPFTNTEFDRDFPLEELKGNAESRGGGISGIQVPRPRYISISKSRLLDAIISELFESQLEADQFVHLSKRLDSVILAEHKPILEDMRVDYDLTNSMESQESVNLQSTFDLRRKKAYTLGNQKEFELDRIKESKMDPLLGSFSDADRTIPLERFAVHTRFQRAFVQLLSNAEFEELSVRDLLLTTSLNTDYLLTLPIYVDWKKAAQSNAIIYRRGYATERQEGLLTGEKLDYLQSMLLQRILFLISRPLKKFGICVSEALKSNKQIQGDGIWAENWKIWLKKLSFLQQSYSNSLFESDSDQSEADQVASSSSYLPLWLAAQRAVTRYEGILSTVGPRGRLLKRLLTWIGIAPSSAEQVFDPVMGSVDGDSQSYSSLSRPIFLSRISLSDIWRPASLKSCGDNFWKMLKTSITILVSRSTLQEPAFKELILFYTKNTDGADADFQSEVPPLELKIYEKIPIPDLPVIFPHKKLSFRILDTVRLDVATILGLLAYFINYKFEDILSSPSAVLLDVIAVSALAIYMFRVVLGYKQTWDRYQLLVNKTLNEKTVASGFGSVHFLLDASQQQQYKEAILAYAILLKVEKCQMASARSVGEECEKFIYEVFKEKIEMPIEKAKETLVRLGLVTATPITAIRGEEYEVLEAVPCSKAAQILGQKWNCLLS
ncbi:OLC1v1033476C1 [Oldenlandia corymbosa var. corymbosa]|uniref:OLC1v1033476C1 n=1 Tax=Oldenlandia corymbosa var. corymbosa TaxID=529605 RepID=A0AAV1CPT4_OLDCO|nr:OLC1v1033476C1 [Oldenlandia corymbosa var. corymbosa]